MFERFTKQSPFHPVGKSALTPKIGVGFLSYDVGGVTGGLKTAFYVLML